jgi:hypothetical protein
MSVSECEHLVDFIVSGVTGNDGIERRDVEHRAWRDKYRSCGSPEIHPLQKTSVRAVDESESEKSHYSFHYNRKCLR